MSIDPSSPSAIRASTGTEARRALRGALLAGVLLLVVVAPAHAVIVEEIVAKVNNRIITKSEFEERGKALVQQIYQQYVGEDLDRELKDAQDGLLANMITESLLMERAETIFDLDKIRASLVSDFRKQQHIDSDQDLQRMLVQQGMTRKELEDQLMRLAVPQEIVNYEVRRKISVSEREIKEYYDSHEEQWETPAQVTFREIVLFYDATNHDEVEKRMKDILDKLHSGADFVDLVHRFSEAGTREADGLLGPVARRDLNQAIANAAFGIGIGDVSEPIDTGRSLHLLRVESRTPKVVQGMEQVRDDIEKAIRQRKFNDRYTRYLKRLWRENQIDIMPKYQHFLVVSPLKQKDQGAEKGKAGA